MRKLSYPIFVILFVIVSLFILKDDFLLAVNKASLYFNKSDTTQVTKIKDTKETELAGKIQTPGALRVFGMYLSSNDKIKLSKDNIINLTNKARKDNGDLQPLTENPKLDLSAEKKLEDMFNKQYFEHISRAKISVGDLGDQVGYEYILIGENLALGNFKDDGALVDAWMASPGHRENILNKHYLDIGVAVGKGIYEGKSVWMAVQHFGTPKSICPTVDKVLYGVISLNQDKIKEMEQDLVTRKENIKKGIIYEGSTYFEQVDKYNSLLNLYNNLIVETKNKVEEYNNQIKAFNLCLYQNE
jgi:uncharacterized protein YkwD